MVRDFGNHYTDRNTQGDYDEDAYIDQDDMSPERILWEMHCPLDSDSLPDKLQNKIRDFLTKRIELDFRDTTDEELQKSINDLAHRIRLLENACLGTSCATGTPTSTTVPGDAALAKLNELLKADPEAVYCTIMNSVPVNQEYSNTEFAIEKETMVSGAKKGSLTALGLINTLLWVEGLPRIAAQIDDDGKLINFMRYTRPASW